MKSTLRMTANGHAMMRRTLLSTKVNDASASAIKMAPATASRGLRISEPRDALEQEADRVANQVMAGGQSSLEWSLSNVQFATPLQRKCACGGSAGAEEECEECRKRREGAPLVDALPLQRRAANQAEPGEVPPIVYDVLRSPGQPLDSSTQAFFEPRFGHDFGKVRAHTDTKAAESARAVHALAYTVGRDVVFGQGQFNPHTLQGGRLLAHELVHVVQRGAGGTPCLQRQTQAVPEPDWRELARRQVPWQQWTTTQKDAAESEYRAAVRRIFEAGEHERILTMDKDNELFRLLRPYQPEMKAYLGKQTMLELDVGATFVSPLKFESTAGNQVRLDAIVWLTNPPTPAAPAGEVLFEVFTEIRQVDAKRVPLVGNCPPNGACNARATYLTPHLSKNKYRVKATYQPLNTGNRSSYSESFIEVK